MKTIQNQNFAGDGLYLSESAYVINCKFHDILGDNHHGIEITGDGKFHNQPKFIIENCVIDNTGIKADQYDEGAALVNAPQVVFNRVRFKNLGKACLVGNGDWNDNDCNLRVTFNQCIFEECSRRNPYVQYGQAVLNNCLIKNWGRSHCYHLKSHGVRVGKDACCQINNTVFWQSGFWPGFKNFWSDITSQYCPILIPGTLRAAYTEGKNNLELNNCYFNHWYLYRNGKRNGKMSRSDALDLINELERTVPKL